MIEHDPSPSPGRDDGHAGITAEERTAALAAGAPRIPRRAVAWLFVAATFASIGLPGFANFWGELTIFVALWNYSHWVTVIALTGTVISAVYGLRAAARVFFGPPSEQFARVCASRPTADLTWGEKVPAMILVGALLFIGFWPKSFSTAVNQALAVPPAGETR